MSCLCLCLVIGCTSKDAPIENPGNIVSITIEEYKQTKEEMVVFLSQPYCSSCDVFKQMLETYLQKHSLTIYEIDMEKEKKSYTQEEWDLFMKDYFPTFEATPGIFYKDVKQEVILLKPTQENISEDGFGKWITSLSLNN